MAELLTRFPLFPLGLVLLPGEVVPLHIFEERYKLMIGECLDDEREFGVLCVSNDGLAEVGCTARVTRLLERLEDGRMNILVEGERPFRLLRRIDDMPYPAGDVELLGEAPGTPDADVAGRARDAYAQLVERATDARPTDAEVTALDAYGMASTLDVALAAKQELLEMRSEQERLERLSELLDATMQRLEHAERAAGRARSNGRVPLGGGSV